MEIQTFELKIQDGEGDNIDIMKLCFIIKNILNATSKSKGKKTIKKCEVIIGKSVLIKIKLYFNVPT